jgi:hypothetical protein
MAVTDYLEGPFFSGVKHQRPRFTENSLKNTVFSDRITYHAGFAPALSANQSKENGGVLA